MATKQSLLIAWQDAADALDNYLQNNPRGRFLQKGRKLINKATKARLAYENASRDKEDKTSLGQKIAKGIHQNWTDNVGPSTQARRDLKKLLEQSEKEELKDALTEAGKAFRFNPGRRTDTFLKPQEIYVSERKQPKEAILPDIKKTQTIQEGISYDTPTANNTIRFKVPKEKVENFSVGNIANQFLDFISQPFGLSDSSFNLQSVTPTDIHDRSDPRWRQKAFRDDLNEEFRRDYQEKKKGGKVKKKKKKKSYTSKKKYSMSGGGKVASVRKPTRA